MTQEVLKLFQLKSLGFKNVGLFIRDYALKHVQMILGLALIIIISPNNCTSKGVFSN